MPTRTTFFARVSLPAIQRKRIFDIKVGTCSDISYLHSDAVIQEIKEGLEIISNALKLEIEDIVAENIRYDPREKNIRSIKERWATETFSESPTQKIWRFN